MKKWNNTMTSPDFKKNVTYELMKVRKAEVKFATNPNSPVR